MFVETKNGQAYLRNVYLGKLIEEELPEIYR